MELKEGCKQTELGWIPEVWEVQNIESIMQSIVRGPFGGALKKEFFVKKGYKVYEQRNAIYQKLNLGHYFVDKIKFNELKRFAVKTGDFIVSCSGTIGKIYRLPSNLEEGIINQALLKLTVNEKKINPTFFYYQFIDDNFQDRVIEDQGGAMKNLVGMPQFKISLLLLPPLPEQKAIAEVLSDTDTLIQAIEEKLAKKRDIKQGAMQQLLMPKEGWEVNKLGEIAHFYNGKAHEQFIDSNGEYTVINSKFISRNGTVFKNSNVNLSPLKKGDITMVMSDIPNGKALAKCFLVPVDDKYALNQRICAIRADDDVDNIFLALILNRNKYYLSFDSGTGQTNLKKKDVLECPIPLPPTKQEQTDIATVLSDMSKEIDLLEEKLSKLKMLKQGLMQNLLTGKIRLV